MNAQAEAVPGATFVRLTAFLRWVLLLLVVAAPALVIPERGAPTGFRWAVVQAAGFGLVALFLLRQPGGRNQARQLLIGPGLPIGALVGWAALSFWLTAPESGRGRDLALVEWARIASGAAVFATTAIWCRRRSAQINLSRLILAGAGFTALVGLWSYGSSRDALATGAYENPQLLAGFLVLQIPLVAALALGGRSLHWRVIAISSLAFLLIALALTRTRSAWIATAVGMTAMGLCWLRLEGRRAVAARRHVWLPAVLVTTICVAGWTAASGTGSVLARRAATLARPASESSVQWRARMAEYSLELAAVRPWTGWGVGSFSRLADENQMGELPGRHQVLAEGASLSSVPHNEYLQTAVELGLPGLALCLAIPFAFLGLAGTALRRPMSAERRWLLLGCMGAVTAQAIDALSNPAWRFGDVAPMWWLVLGLGVAVSRRSDHPIADPSPTRPRPISTALIWRPVALVIVLTVAAGAFAATVGDEGGAIIAGYNPRSRPKVDVNVEAVNLRGRPGRPSRRRFLIHNRGQRNSLLVGQVVIVPSVSPFTVIQGQRIQLEKGQCQYCVVEFVPPSTSGTYAATAEIRTNDPLRPVASVPLRGTVSD